jgi:hypothetical protein
MRFVEKAKYRILNPIRLDKRFEDVAPLITVATKFLDLRWLRCIRDLETYLLSVVKLSLTLPAELPMGKLIRIV